MDLPSLERCEGRASIVLRALGHVGKPYHGVAWEACEAILELDGVEGVTVRLLSRIGRRVDRPVTMEIEVAGEMAGAVDPDVLSEVRRRLVDAVADWCGASRRRVEGGEGGYEVA